MAFNNFPYTNFHELNLDWIIQTAKDANATADSAIEKSTETRDYVDNYFDNLDVQDEIDHRIDDMIDSGDFQEIITDYTPGDVIVVTASWGREVAYQGSGPITPFTEILKSKFETFTNNHLYYTAESGAGFANGELLTGLQSIANTIPLPYKVRTIIVVGGGNDVTHTTIDDTDTPVTRTMIANGMQAFSRYCKTIYPNATLRFAWCSWRRTTSENRPLEDYNKTIEWFKELCPRNGMAFCANSEFLFHVYYEDWYNAEGVYKDNHPSSLGSQHIADHIWDCIFNGSTDINRSEYFDGSTNPFLTRDPVEYADFQIYDCVNFTIKQSNGITQVIPNATGGGPTFKVPPGRTAFPEGWGNAVELGDFTSGLLKCAINGDNKVRFPLVGVLERTVEGDTAYKTVYGIGTFSYSKLFVMFPRDWTWQAGYYQVLNVYIPTVTIETNYC